jgi:diguanylate cyclase (GGDEF)-like protein/PAS domain S-box-containing protein
MSIPVGSAAPRDGWLDKTAIGARLRRVLGGARRGLRQCSSLNVVVAAIIGLFLSVATATVVTYLEGRGADAEFVALADNRRQVLHDGLRRYIDRMVAARALFDALDHDLGREAFETFAAGIVGDDPAIENISWYPRVARAERAALEAAAVRDGITGYRISTVTPDGAIAPLAERDEYFPLLYSSAPRDNPIYGFDISSEAMRAGVVARARDNDAIAASAIIRLRTNAAGENGFFMLTPVYRHGLPHDTLEERRRNLAGFVQTALRLGATVEAILQAAGTPRGLDIYFYAERAEPDAPPVYIHASRLDTRPAAPRTRAAVEAGPHWSGTLDIAGAALRMVVVPIRSGKLMSTLARFWAVLALGLLLTLWSMLHLGRMRLREDMLHTVTLIAADLMPATTLEAAVPKALKAVGERIGADRLIVLESIGSPDGAALLTDTYVWSSPEAGPQMQVGALRTMPGAEQFAAWLAAQGGKATAVAARTIRGPMGRLLEGLAMKSALWVPILVEGSSWGYLGIGDCRAERRWQAAETDTLTLVAELIGTTIDRVRTLGELEQANRIADNSTTVLYRCAGEPSLPVTFVSRGAAKFGYDPKELIAEPNLYHSLLHPDDQARLAEMIRRFFEDGIEADSIQYRLRMHDGSYRWFDNRVTANRDAGGRLTSVDGILVDITEIKQIEHVLAFANILLTAAQENSPDGMLVVDADARIVSFNHRFAEMFQIPHALVAGQADEPVLQAVVSQMQDPDQFLFRVRYLYDHPEITSHEEIRLKDGRIFDRHSGSLTDAAGHYLGRIWYFRDITGRKRAEADLHQQNLLLQAINESVGSLLSAASLAEAIPKSLERIGAALRGDRLVVIELQEESDGRRQWAMRHQWHAPALPVELLAGRLARISPQMPDIASWLAPLRTGNPVAVTRETANATVGKILESERLWSILLIPILIEGSCFGHIELDDATPGRQWKPAEIDLLVSLGSLIGAAIARERRLEAMAEADTIIRHSPTVLYRQGAGPSWPLTYISPNIAKLGIDPVALLGAPISYLGLIHPDDRATAAAALERILDAVAGGGIFEFRLRTGDGIYCWMESRSTPVRDRDGRLLEVEGILTDITERKAAEDELKRAHGELLATVHVLRRHEREMMGIARLNDMLQACDSRDAAFPIIAAAGDDLFPGTSGALMLSAAGSRAAGVVLRWGPDRTMPDLDFHESPALAGPDPDAGRSDLAASPDAPDAQPPHTGGPYECLPLTLHGEPMGLLYVRMNADTALEEGLQRLMLTFGDVIKLSLVNLGLRESLREQAMRDQLTGLFNRHYLAEFLPRETDRARRSGAPLAIAMLDIDNFKTFNDSHGHDAGDEVLRAMGNVLRKATRASDIACRYGGEEFLLALPGCGPLEAQARLQQICAEVKQTTFVVNGQSLPTVSISVGLSQMSDELACADEMITAADQALYAAKKAGRDRIEHFSSRSRNVPAKPAA